jgi:MFS family permease
MFIAGRVIKGLGEGLFLGTVTVYVCEIAPARRRGPLASIPQFMVNVGIAMGYFIAYGTARIMGSSASWRLPLAIHSMMAFGFCGACFFVPPSPRWLLVKGRREKAIETLEQLGLDSSELEEMLVAPERSDAASVRGSLLSSIRSNFRDMGEVFHTSARKQTTLACFMMAMQQFSGIDGVLYYAPLLFQQAGLASEQAAFLASGISALAMLAVTIPASIYADHWSRRMSVMLGGLVLATFMLLIGSLYASSSVHGDHGAARWVVVVLIYLFAMTFCSTWGISIRIYASEIQPSKTRAPAANLAQSANWVRKNADAYQSFTN